MKKAAYYLRLFFGKIGFIILFFLNFIFIFTALGVFALGLIVFPTAFLGLIGVLPVISSLGLPVLLMGGIGMILFGGGMCLGAVFMCRASVNSLHYFRKGMWWKKRRLKDEEA